MYVRDEDDFSILKRAEKILHEQFHWNIKDDDFKGFVNEDEYEIIDNLCDEIERLRDELEDKEQEMKEFYKPISPYEFYGVNEGDFH